MKIPSLALAALVSCSPRSAIEVGPSAPVASLMTDVQIPEDLLAVPGTSWVLVSNLIAPNKPGWLSVIDAAHPESGAHRVFPTAAMTPVATERCPGPPDLATFFPHGINVRPRGNAFELLVVNHGSREAIELFELTIDTQAPKVVWHDCLVLPRDVSANGVDTLADGTIVATSMFDPADRDVIAKVAHGEPTGRVVAYRNGAWHDLAPLRLSFANGIATSKRYVFVSEWGARRLWRIPLDAAATPTSVTVDFLPDNLRWTPRGTLLLAGQRTDAASLFTCTTQYSPCPPEFSVVEIDPESLEVKPRLRAGDGRFGGGTVALEIGDELWIGSAAVNALARYRGQ